MFMIQYDFSHFCGKTVNNWPSLVSVSYIIHELHREYRIALWTVDVRGQSTSEHWTRSFISRVDRGRSRLQLPTCGQIEMSYLHSFFLEQNIQSLRCCPSSKRVMQGRHAIRNRGPVRTLHEECRIVMFMHFQYIEMYCIGSRQLFRIKRHEKSMMRWPEDSPTERCRSSVEKRWDWRVRATRKVEQGVEGSAWRDSSHDVFFSPYQVELRE